ncbi:hypothetical protein CDO52_09395 [Nocardiopsis gilva YIM 90087]|uniref:Subtilisin inhibitor domain-containing protein n=1 Tax=Nocardiopsis gilva YIM 90087 TaxID=1235441 RepID=A0A223S4C2_9ACTN|nr:SSI family serine proteinase inhibitor [Nocardiopsis gilva]ASU82975.1 hypothetical protein CDO52_09395 [Nocardiopsis gilva YIM 90087]
MSICKTFGAVAGAFVIAATMFTGTANAATLETVDADASATYWLAVVPGSLTDPDRPLDWSQATSVTLNCDPATGDHPNPKAACDLIEKSGSIASIEKGAICPKIYMPVTAFASGGEQYRETYPNKVCLNSDKGAVYQF